jgi:hypothetical protein
MPSFRRTYFEDLLESNFLKAKMLRGRQLPFFFRFMALLRCVNASLRTPDWTSDWNALMPETERQNSIVAINERKHHVQ